MKRTLIILTSMVAILSLAACSSEAPSTGSDQVLGERANRIVGGSTYEGLPAVGSLTYNGSQHCTGTLIGPRKVLTAAHCVSGFSASKMRFAIGPSLSQVQYNLPVASIEAHPQYGAYNITNDIGLVILAQDAPIAPLGVVSQMDSSWTGQSLFFVGYGVSNGYNQTGSGLKRAVWMDISSVSSTTFRYDDPDRNTCNGDSGGPAFHVDSAGNYLVAGVTSYGDQYCAQYGVDTKVAAYMDFLDLDDAPVQQDPCAGETWEGRCQDNTVIWCENDQVGSQDCSDSGKVCGFANEQGYYACLEVPEDIPEEPVDPCAGETFEGRCDGNNVIWCEGDKVNNQDCAATGQTCTYDAAKSYYACRDAAPVDPCNGETWEGRCEGNSVVWCENEEVNSMNCNNSCSYNSAKGYYDCM